jgi:hypothetical protein
VLAISKAPFTDRGARRLGCLGCEMMLWPRVCAGDCSPIDRALRRMSAEPAIEQRGGRELQVEVEEQVEAARSSRESGWLEMKLEQR